MSSGSCPSSTSADRKSQGSREVANEDSALKTKIAITCSDPAHDWPDVLVREEGGNKGKKGLRGAEGNGRPGQARTRRCPSAHK